MIGVAISTRNRRPQFLATLPHWLNHLPQDATLVIVDDASDEPLQPIDGAHIIRHGYRRGVAMTKNRCITELINMGCTDLFLADDDVWPTTPDWWKPYIESPEQHLSYQWCTRQPWTTTFDDGQHWAIGFPRGVLLYTTQQVVDTVGGMDPAYLSHGGEHVAWQQRIHNAGYGQYPFMDVHGSDLLFRSFDKEQGGTQGSTIPLPERRQLVQSNALLWDHTVTKDFVPYRENIQGVQDRGYAKAPTLGATFEAVLDHALMHRPPGVALEFGVGQGNSVRRIAQRMFTYGFDSWQGLPERWRDGFETGMFACEPPDIPNTHLVQGLVQDTIRHFDFHQAGHIGLLHFDLDLYSSTTAVLEGIEARGLVNQVFKPGLIVVFDEFLGYQGHQEHEMLAWNQFADRTQISWTLIGRGPEQLALRVL